MSRVHKAIIYLWIAYLAVMLCCVQYSYMHHSMHSDMAGSHSTISPSNISSLGTSQMDHGSQTPTSGDFDQQSEQTLFNTVHIVSLVLGAVLVLLILIPKLITQPPVVFISIYPRRKRKRKSLLTFFTSLGLRAPPLFA